MLENTSDTVSWNIFCSVLLLDARKHIFDILFHISQNKPFLSI